MYLLKKHVSSQIICFAYFYIKLAWVIF